MKHFADQNVICRCPFFENGCLISRFAVYGCMDSSML